MSDPTARFSDRVDNYVKYRPGYPAAVLDLLRQEGGWNEQSVVADVGSGTGILTEMYLQAGNEVFAVEPNLEMRTAAERLLAGYPRLHSVAGTAEQTGLADHSVDLVSAGQAFHWFDPVRAKVDFQRILRPQGAVALIWNKRLTTTSSFLIAYEAFLLQHGTDYKHVDHTRISEVMLAEFFRPGHFVCHSFFNRQVFDREGLRGRMLSSSYVPAAGQSGYGPMLADLDALFETHQEEGKVFFDYDTNVYLGRFED